MPDPERAERTRSTVLDAAAREFDAFGYDGARLDRIVTRTGLTKGAVYFHFASKLALAEALVADKYALWPTLIEQVSASGLRGLKAARSLTLLVARTLVSDVRARAAMNLTQSILPPPATDDPYIRWIAVIAELLAQSPAQRRRTVPPESLARVAVQTFFGAYRIAAEMGHLETLEGDVEHLWDVLAETMN